MLAHESTYCVGVPGGNAEVSLKGLRAILGQVEAELYQSEIYGQMLSSLKALPEDLTRQVQCMVRAVSREAIRLSLRKLVRKKPAVIIQAAGQGMATLPTAAPKLLQPPAPPPPNASLNDRVTNALDCDRRLTPTAPVSPPDTQPTHLLNGRVTLYPPTATPTAKGLNAHPHKVSKKELAMQAALQAREAYLRDLGQAMRQVRQEKAWSPYHLHIKTQIPMHQLEALETGHIERLPEDIYLRGFIRQVGKALGLDGDQMAASLPAIDTATNVLPSWQQAKAPSGLRLSSMHVYLGYAALMAGGIAWVSHQSAPHPSSPAATPPATPATVVPSPKDTPATASKTNQKAAALTSKQGAVAPANVSSPERSPL